MKLDEILHRAGRHKRRTRVGRGTGSGHGKTAGRGTKGYYSRSGARHRLGYEGGGTTLYLRMPKRGFSNARFSVEFQVVNVGDLESFEDGARVDAAVLQQAGLIARAASPLKILGGGEIKKKLTVAACRFSVSAIKKILDAGGTPTTPKGEAVKLPAPPPPKPAPEAKPAKGEAKAAKPPKGAKGGEAKAGKEKTDEAKAAKPKGKGPKAKAEGTSEAPPAEKAKE
jgi:large subunit ribosomal protein L15